MADRLKQNREQASFDSNEMRRVFETDDQRLIQDKTWRYLLNDPLFAINQAGSSTGDEKERVCKQLNKFTKSGLFNNLDTLDYVARTKYLMLVNEATEMYNPCLSIKFALGVSLFGNTLHSLGTERHNKFAEDVWSGKILSCLALTELEHGSDTKRMKTVATYDHSTKEFVLNSPDIGAAKCWVGNLGRHCTHALLYAQLVVNGAAHGFHGFVVPIRDPSSLKPYDGITVGDVGEKAGLNGIDNGFVLFHNYRIPKDNLLNRIGDVNDNGEYESSFSDPQRILGAALESLSAGRVAILQESSNTLIKAIVIAVRYSAQRVQFSDCDGNELPIIEYQTHQWRLFPYLAASFVMTSFVKDVRFSYIECVAQSRMGEVDMKEVAQKASGFHAVVCCSKALVTWTSRDAIQECREACGGHGYHKGAALGDLRSNHDPRVTFEGDNTVLLQQTSNWILRISDDPETDFNIYPSSVLAFIRDSDSVLQRTMNASQLSDTMTFSFVKSTYEWLICWLIKATKSKIIRLSQTERDKFKVRNMTQVFKARTLSLAFAEYNMIVHFENKIQNRPKNIMNVLRRLELLYGLWSLYKHVPVLYQGGYSNNPRLADFLSEGILELCHSIRPDAVALVDSISPPDFILNSFLGYSDGRVYERMMDVFYQSNPSLAHRRSKL